MKKILLTIVAVLFSSTSYAGFAEHPNLAHLNTFTTSIIQKVDDDQAAFYATNGIYFRGLWLLGRDNLTVDGNTDLLVDNATNPDNFGFTWKDFDPALFKNNLKIPVNVKIDTYVAPEGAGWVLIAELYIDGLGPDAYGNEGTHWVYYHHVGPGELPYGPFDEWHVE